jgi:hypothetical protein
MSTEKLFLVALKVVATNAEACMIFPSSYGSVRKKNKASSS